MPKNIAFNPIPQQPLDPKTGRFTNETIRFLQNLLGKVNGSDLTLDETETVATNAQMTANVALASIPSNTDSLPEGSVNLYYTQARREEMEAFAFFMS